MKYSELIQFEPVEGVVKLRQADERKEAERLVRTYVISDRMADVILHRILPTLSLERGEETGGLFVVGNYGTGKSHLMSLVSAIAEHEDLVEYVSHPAASRGLQKIAGHFCVVRQEFGSTNMPLRDVVLGYLQEGLRRLGIEVNFPSMDQAPNTKDLLAHAMTLFHQKYPEKGLLVVIDELLEFLLGRRERELIVDLAFLREIGEACTISDLRFIAGIQESLFDNPRFQFAADSIRRVRDRFHQVRIVREDVAFVVSRRLLLKNEVQKRRIRAHLEKFAPLYELMAERMDEFVELFPIHPAYLEMFERVTVIEKRQALKAISQEMKRILNNDVPSGQPGLISFDAFWRLIQEDPAYRSTPEIREVMDKSRVLEERIKNAMTSEVYRPAALRIIHALSLHWLTTGDLRAPIGLTPKELRDRLCLHLPIPEDDASFLLTSVESALQEISRTVSGQFISHNTQNDQYYLDLDKDIDFDALIEQRAAVLDGDTLDRYYFDALRRILELSESTYRPGFRIWQVEIPWQGHGITRDGYIFLGAPNERSTTEPQRDFYLHFLSIFNENGKSEEPKPDEVFFNLAHTDDTFHQSLRLYAGAREMSALSSGSNKIQFERRADFHLNAITRWLRENFAHAFEVRHGSKQRSIADCWGEYRLAKAEANLRDQVYQLASAMLNAHFEEKYPHYPPFRNVQLTSISLPQAAQSALRALAGGPITQQARSLLEGLELLGSGEGISSSAVLESRYTAEILKKLHELEPGQVINRAELLSGSAQRERETSLGLEPALLMIILVALLRQGEITLNWMGRTFTSDNLDEVVRIEVEDLARFSSIARPKAIPEQALKALFEGLGLPVEWIDDSAKHEHAALEVSRLAQEELPRLAMVLDALRTGFRYWGEPFIHHGEIRVWQQALEHYRDLLQTLERINTPGRLRQFSLGVGEVRAKLKGRELLRQIIHMQELLQSLQPHLNYLNRAELRLPTNHSWQKQAENIKQEHLSLLRNPKMRTEPSLYARLNGGLNNLRTMYIEAYLQLHQMARLDRAGDERKRSLTQDTRWRQLLALQDISILPESEFRRLQQDFNNLRSCPVLTAEDLRDHTECPHCGFDPRTEEIKMTAHESLEAVYHRLEQLHTSWLTRLREELSKPEVAQDVTLLKSPYREQVLAFMNEGTLPSTISQNFIQSINDVLQGLEKVVLEGTEFFLALTQGGMPCTIEELYQRLEALLQKRLGDKNRKKVRIEIDW